MPDIPAETTRLSPERVIEVAIGLFDGPRTGKDAPPTMAKAVLTALAEHGLVVAPAEHESSHANEHADLAAIRERINRAHTELGDVCAQGPSRRFRMHIPADPERDTDLIISAALNDADLLAGEVEQLRAEVARLRAGEADTPGEEGAELTPAQWIRRWNDATPEERLRVAEAGRANAKAAYRCFLMDHEGRLADAEEVERLRAAVARVREFAEQVSRGRSRVVSRDFLTPMLIRLLDAPPEEQTGGGNG